MSRSHFIPLCIAITTVCFLGVFFLHPTYDNYVMVTVMKAETDYGPFSQEVCDNGVDDDCDGLTDTCDPKCADSISDAGENCPMNLVDENKDEVCAP